MCADINKLALEWALHRADQHALDLYNKYGKKLVIGSDLDNAHIGPVFLL